MFDRQASSLSRTGTILLVMLALVSGVHLNESTSMASDNVGGEMAKNGTSSFASSNLTGRGQSMLRSFNAPPKGLGITFQDVTFPNGFTLPSGVPDFSFSCTVPCATPEATQKGTDCMGPYNPPTANGSELCDYWKKIGQCCIDVACTCSDNSSKKASNDIFEILKKPTICGDKAKLLSCSSATSQAASQVSSQTSSNKTLWIILAVVGAVIVVIVVIGVVVCCCCMGGGGGRSRRNNRKSSKHSLKGGSKSKIRKASSKHRASSKPRASSRASSRPTSRASSRPTSRASSRPTSRASSRR